MTRYFVNDREVAAPAGMASLDEILKHIENQHLAPDTVIRQIHIDGLPVTPETLGNGGQILQQIQNREKVEFFTGTLAEIAQDSIAEAQDYLGRVETLTPALSLSFQDNPGTEAFENLRQLYEGFYFINLLLERLAGSFQINLGEAFVEGLSVQDHLQKFISILKQLIEGQERRDCVLIADLLEYEILPGIPVWKEIFSVVAQKVNRAQ